MTQNEFLEKYKSQEFYIETVDVGGAPTYIVSAKSKTLSMEESDLFWTLYQEAETIYSDSEIEIVKF